MKLYYPNATVAEIGALGNVTYDHQYTYDGYVTMKKAIKCIRDWQTFLLIKEAWIDIKDTDNDTTIKVPLTWNIYCVDDDDKEQTQHYELTDEGELIAYLPELDFNAVEKVTLKKNSGKLVITRSFRVSV